MDSTIRGIPLGEEPLGALTLGGFLREVCAKYADNEALVFHAAVGACRTHHVRAGLGRGFTVARAWSPAA